MSKEKEALYTARWYSREIQEHKDTPDLVLSLALEQEAAITAGLGDGKPPVEAPKPGDKPGAMADWYPAALKMTERMPERGTYKKGYPRGAVVHFTSGRDGAAKTIKGGIKDGFTYVCIQRDGKLFQAHPISKWGYHAGKSAWAGLEGTVSDELIGIEINCAGGVKKQSDGTFKSWFGTTLKDDEVRYSKGEANQDKGYYEKYTPEQEKTLIDFILWLKGQAPDVFDLDLVVGHDEVAPGRKDDPGASLSMTMPAFREHLKASAKALGL